MSMLSPDNTMYVVPFSAGMILLVGRLARPNAPLPSISILVCSIKMTTASAIESSSTSITWSTPFVDNCLSVVARSSHSDAFGERKALPSGEVL